ncbi:hypothetical protein [Mycoplasmopsis edwardii]|nr:hypothetical protein [Mycoplasmopsis edwardii]
MNDPKKIDFAFMQDEKFKKIISSKIDNNVILNDAKKNKIIGKIITDLEMTDAEILKFVPTLFIINEEQKNKTNLLWETVLYRNDNNQLRVGKRAVQNNLNNEFKIEQNIMFKEFSKPITNHLIKTSKLKLDSDHSDIIEYINEFLKDPIKANSLYLSGNIKSNRSYILSVIANEYALIGKEVAYIDINMLDDKIRRSFEKRDIDIDILIKDFSTVDVLIFDEIGFKNVSKWFLESIFIPILWNRYQNPELKTFFGAYYNFDDLFKQLFKKSSTESIDVNSPIVQKMIFLIDKISLEKVWISEYE